MVAITRVKNRHTMNRCSRHKMKWCRERVDVMNDTATYLVILAHEAPIFVAQRGDFSLENVELRNKKRERNRSQRWSP